MERIMKAQALSQNESSGLMLSRKVLEINTDHSVIRSMKTKADAESEPNDYILKPSYNAPLAKIGARPDVNKMAPLIIREPKKQ